MTWIYKHPLLYEAVILSLYGRAYTARYRTIADLIPPHASVLDLCCGPATLFHRYLRYKEVDYTGLDLSQSFIRRLQSRGGHGEVRNIQDPTPLPQADFVVMHASLYHFLPDAKPVVDRMLTAALKQVIIAEPIRNIVDCKNQLAANIARRLTNPGDGHSAHRFTSESLDQFFVPYRPRIQNSFLMPGSRERVFVINAKHDRDERDSSLVFTNIRVTSGASVPRS